MISPHLVNYFRYVLFYCKLTSNQFSIKIITHKSPSQTFSLSLYVPRFSNPEITKQPSEAILYPSIASSSDTIIRSQVQTNHLSNGIDQCRRYGNSMARHRNDASTLLSKKWQSIGLNPIRVESKKWSPHWSRDQMKSQKVQDRGIKSSVSGKKKQIAIRLLAGKKARFCTIAIVCSDTELLSKK